MSVHRRPEKKKEWQVKWREGGRGSRQRSVSFVKERDAKNYDAKVRVEKAERGSHSPVVAPKKITIGKLADEFLQWVEIHRAPNTHHFYRDRAKSVFSVINPQVLVTNIGQHTDRLIRAKYGKVDNGTINKDLGFLRRIVRFAQKKRYLAFDPLAALEKLPENRAEKRKNMRFYDADQVNRFLAYTPREKKALYLLFFGVGLRISEIRSLTWGDINFQSGELQVIGKRGKLRTVPLPQDALQALKDHPRREGTEYVFPNKKGGPLGDIRKSTWRIMEAAGLPRINFHQMRHSFAATMVMDEVYMKNLQELLGHEQLSTTMDIYGHLTKRHLKQTVERHARLRGSSKPTDDGGGGNVVPIEAAPSGRERRAS